MLENSAFTSIPSQLFIYAVSLHHFSPSEDCIPMYLPSIAVLGVLNPRPTSLYHLLPPLPGPFALDAFEPRLWLRKTCGCFWKARSPWIVNSVAMIAVLCNQSGWRGRWVVFRGAGFAEVVLLVRARIWLRAPSSDNRLSEIIAGKVRRCLPARKQTGKPHPTRLHLVAISIFERFSIPARAVQTQWRPQRIRRMSRH